MFAKAQVIFWVERLLPVKSYSELVVVYIAVLDLFVALPNLLMLRFQRFQKQPTFYELLFGVCLMIVLLVASPWVSAKEYLKPKMNLQAWQINGILAALNDGSPKVRQTAFGKLLGFDAKNFTAFPKQAEDIAQKAIALANDSASESELRIIAAAALGNLGKTDERVTQFLVDFINDSKAISFRRSEAIDALKYLGKTDQRVVKYLANFVDGSNEPIIRSNAVDAMGEISTSDSSLVQFLTDVANSGKESSDLRQKAIDSLGKLGKADGRAVQALESLANNTKADSEFSFRFRAIGSLVNLGKADNTIVQSLKNIVYDSKERYDHRVSATVALVELGKVDSSMVQFLADLASPDFCLSSSSSSHFYNCYDVISALGELGKADESVVHSLRNLFNFNDSEDWKRKLNLHLRINVAEALGKLGKADDNTMQFLTALASSDSSAFSKAESYLPQLAIFALGRLGKTDGRAVQSLTNLVSNNKIGFENRISAADELVKLRKTDEGVVQFLTTSVNDRQNSYNGDRAADILGNIRQLNLIEVFSLIESIYYEGSRSADSQRFVAYFYSGGDSKITTLLKWIGLPDSKSIPTHLTHSEARATLEVFQELWEPSRNFDRIRSDLARAIAKIANMGRWETGDAGLLTQHYQNLKDVDQGSASSIKEAINSLTVWQSLLTARNLILLHLTFWLVIIFLYPKSPTIQALFFWNPWVRTIVGLGYVSALLVTVPFLQRRLFAPFQKDLRQAAGLDQFDPTAYFQESRVNRSLWDAGKETEETLPLPEAIPNLKGQMLLQAPSGFGKTMFLRHLINQSPQRIIVFLTATECAQAKDHDVIQAIQAKLPIAASDLSFLKSLIYSGAIDICIDGLNEINAEAQATIKQFLSSYTKGNIILTTQSLSDKNPPQSAKLYRLLPLEDKQISHFLTSRHPKDAVLQGDDYQQACDAYLKEVLNPNQTDEELVAVHRVLSNPMDLDTVAEMLAQKERPKLFRLQQQLYERMAADYVDKNNGFNFPLKPVAQLAYDMRLSDQNLLPKDKLSQEIIDILEKHKLLTPKSGFWQFRHDKIWDFFIVQKYLEDQQKAYEELREREKMKDTRLRGVYLQLATELDLPIAQDLEKALFAYASSTGDHTTSDPFRRRLESHPQAPAPIPL